MPRAQSWHSLHHSAISAAIQGHTKRAESSLLVALMPGWDTLCRAWKKKNRQALGTPVEVSQRRSSPSIWKEATLSPGLSRRAKVSSQDLWSAASHWYSSRGWYRPVADIAATAGPGERPPPQALGRGCHHRPWGDFRSWGLTGSPQEGRRGFLLPHFPILQYAEYWQ